MLKEIFREKLPWIDELYVICYLDDWGVTPYLASKRTSYLKLIRIREKNEQVVEYDVHEICEVKNGNFLFKTKQTIDLTDCELLALNTLPKDFIRTDMSSILKDEYWQRIINLCVVQDVEGT